MFDRTFCGSLELDVSMATTFLYFGWHFFLNLKFGIVCLGKMGLSLSYLCIVGT